MISPSLSLSLPVLEAWKATRNGILDYQLVTDRLSWRVDHALMNLKNESSLLLPVGHMRVTVSRRKACLNEPWYFRETLLH